MGMSNGVNNRAGEWSAGEGLALINLFLQSGSGGTNAVREALVSRAAPVDMAERMVQNTQVTVLFVGRIGQSLCRFQQNLCIPIQRLDLAINPDEIGGTEQQAVFA